MYTIFTLSTKRQEATLVLNGKALGADETPSYLGITLDRHLTWKPQINKAQARAKLRLGIMRKLAGTTWGADMNVLKKLYIGRVRPVLEYGMSAWSSSSQTNFDKIKTCPKQRGTNHHWVTQVYASQPYGKHYWPPTVGGQTNRQSFTTGRKV